MRLLRLCRSSMNIRFPTIFFFRIQRCNSFPFQPRSHLGPLISSLGCFSKFPKIPTLSYTPNMALFSFQRSTTLGGGRVSLTCNNPGTPSGAHAPRPPRRFRSAVRNLEAPEELRGSRHHRLRRPKTELQENSFFRFLGCPSTVRELNIQTVEPRASFLCASQQF